MISLVLFSIVYFAVIGLLIFGWLRNHWVFNFRMEMLDKVSEAADDDIKKGRHNWLWRYDVLRSVSYNEMVYHFWKPLKWQSFWKNNLFMQKDAVPSSLQDLAREERLAKVNEEN